MFIGLTGLIGAGKSTAARIMATHGAAIIDADQIAREVVDLYPALRKKLVARFGKSILTPTGQLRRKKLAEVAFADEEAGQQLNSIIHPYIGREIKRRMKQLSRRHQVVVIDAALLLDSSVEDDMDQILVIHASREIRLYRLVSRGMSEADVRQRMQRQLPFAEFKRRADQLILNQDSVRAFENKVASYLKKIVLVHPGIG